MSERGAFMMDKCEAFAIRIINVYKFLLNEKEGSVMSKQLLRCGTSIGANMAEAQEAISTPDFLSKMFISLKEASETLYWLRLLYRTGYLSESQYQSIYADAEEIKKILTTSAINAKLNYQRSKASPQ